MKKHKDWRLKIEGIKAKLEKNYAFSLEKCCSVKRETTKIEDWRLKIEDWRLKIGDWRLKIED